MFNLQAGFSATSSVLSIPALLPSCSERTELFEIHWYNCQIQLFILCNYARTKNILLVWMMIKLTAIPAAW